MKDEKTDPQKFDLHVHSTASDGFLHPSELVDKAIESQLSGLALTDHDSLNGLAEFMSVQTPGWFHLIPGIEVETSYRGNRAHLLGYYVSDKRRAITAQLTLQQEMRQQRLLEMISNLRNSGIELPTEFLETGEKLSISLIAELLVREGHSDTGDQAKTKFLQEGGIAYVEKKRLEILDMISVLLSDGAIPVLAHPLTMNLSNIRKCLAELSSYGLSGVEAYYDYSHHSVSGRIEDVVEIGNELGLILTGGTDYHSDETSPSLGSISVGIEVIEQLRRARKVAC
jgi:predicted metal-dependent phosphoesterase TrpH